MTGGYAGKILRVNLTSRTTSIEEPEEVFYRLYVGGAGFVAYYLLKEMTKGIAPLSPQNKLIFALGPLAGTTIQGGGARSCVGAKSPLTGLYGKGEVAGFWGAELKRAGYDAIIVEGKADSPVYLWVHDSEVEIRDASHLWGLLTKEAQETIRQDTGEPLARTALIGPAGEKMVLFSCIIMDVAGHAVAHSGLGAVMGSKNLKGIAVRGRTAPAVADPERVRALTRFMADRENVLARSRALATYGTAGDGMAAGNEQGDLCVRNWRDGYFEEAGPGKMSLKDSGYLLKMESCYGCSVRCKKVVEIAEGPYTVDPAYGGPEYEALDSFGPLCGVSDLAAICKANEFCNAYGMNVISAGSVIALAMECFEKGFISLEDTGGIDLRFGNAQAMVRMVEMMGKREGIGDLLAEGSRRVAQRIGRGSEAYAMHSKGEDLKMHDLRLQRGRAVSNAVEPWGADRGVSDTGFVNPGTAGYAGMQALGHHHTLTARDMGPAKVAMIKDLSMRNSFVDCAVFCFFVPWTILEMEDIMRAVTGWNFTTTELLRVGERVENMARAFSVREGLTAADDRLPQRLFEPTPTGAHREGGIDPAAFQKAVKYWYHLMGYNSKGIPTREKMEELGVGWVADALKLPSIFEG